MHHVNLKMLPEMKTIVVDYPDTMTVKEVITKVLSQLIPIWEEIEKRDNKPLDLPPEGMGMILEGNFKGVTIKVNVYRIGLKYWLEDRKRSAKRISSLIEKEVNERMNLPAFVGS